MAEAICETLNNMWLKTVWVLFQWEVHEEWAIDFTHRFLHLCLTMHQTMTPWLKELSPEQPKRASISMQLGPIFAACYILSISLPSRFNSSIICSLWWWNSCYLAVTLGDWGHLQDRSPKGHVQKWQLSRFDNGASWWFSWWWHHCARWWRPRGGH